MSNILFVFVVAYICYTAKALHRRNCQPRVPGAACDSDEDCIVTECCKITPIGKRSSGVSRVVRSIGTCQPYTNECYTNNIFNCPKCTGSYVCQGTGVLEFPYGERGQCVLPSEIGGA